MQQVVVYTHTSLRNGQHSVYYTIYNSRNHKPIPALYPQLFYATHQDCGQYINQGIVDVPDFHELFLYFSDDLSLHNMSHYNCTVCDKSCNVGEIFRAFSPSIMIARTCSAGCYTKTTIGDLKHG